MVDLRSRLALIVALIGVNNLMLALMSGMFMWFDYPSEIPLFVTTVIGGLCITAGWHFYRRRS